MQVHLTQPILVVPPRSQVNLWRLTSVLDSERAALVSEILAGAFVGPLEESEIKPALHAAGEMERWERGNPSAGDLGQLEQAQRAIEFVLKSLPPCRAHTELKHARDSLLEAKNYIHQACQFAKS